MLYKDQKYYQKTLIINGSTISINCCWHFTCKYKTRVEVAPSEVTCNVKILNKHHFMYNTAKSLFFFFNAICIPLVNKTVRNVQSCEWHFESYIHDIFASFCLFVCLFSFGFFGEGNGGMTLLLLFADIRGFVMFFALGSERLMGLTPVGVAHSRALRSTHCQG